MTLPKVWSATAYGWGVVYVLTVEGVDCVFAERELGLTLPGSGPFASYSAEDGSLVVDDSGPVGSEIDRAQGVGAGFSFGFALLDTSTVRTHLLAPTYTAKLTDDVSVSDVSVSVDDNSSWPTSGSFWLGVERVTYTGKGGSTSFTGCTRGTAGGKAYAHQMGGASGIVTSSPRWWVGRECTLWAYAVDPIGQVPGSTYGDADNVVCVWRGYIEEGPQRIAQGFRFEASSLDRRLDRPFQAKVTGSVAATGARYNVQPTTQFKIEVAKSTTAGVQSWSHALEFKPFSALSSSSTYSGAQLRGLVASSFATALAALGSPATTRIDSLRWIEVFNVAGKPSSGSLWRAQIVIKAAAVSASELIKIYLNADGLPSSLFFQIVIDPSVDQYAPAMQLNTFGFLDTYDSPMIPKGHLLGQTSGVTIELDDGSPSLVDAPATVEIKVNDSTLKMTAGVVSSTEGQLYLSGFTSISGPADTAATIGKSAAIVYSAAGSVKKLLLEHLHSSGTAGSRDSTYDTLARAQGYGLLTSRVNQPSFGLASEGVLQSLALDMMTGDRSFVDIFGGLLALTGRAVVARVDVTDAYRQIKLQLVSTKLGGSGGDVTITDADLLTLAESPVEILDRQRPINLVKLQLDNEASINYTDQAAVDVFGTVEQSWDLPHNNRSDVYSFATPLVAAYIAAQPTIQTMSIRVGPNIDAHVGDRIRVSLSHPSIYDWQTGAQGYVGPAVVLGRSFDLRTMAITLTIAASAAIKSAALSPSMLITAYSAGNYIEVDRGWYTHLATTLADSDPFNLILYDPGTTEATSNYLTCDGVTDTGSAARLSIDSISGALTPSANTTRATLPETATATEYQKRFSHVADGGAWI
tara:strand:- start:617 stop:3205 length:2589 start_codon:yes stop_codon:yes gene_type:complete